MCGSPHRGGRWLLRAGCYPMTWRLVRARALSKPLQGPCLCSVPFMPIYAASLAVHTPGHTHGSTSCLFPDASIAFTGDALVTHDSVAGPAGPCVICRAFTQDSRAALASLEKIAEHELATVLPGHDEPWTDGLARAARQAMASGIR